MSDIWQALGLAGPTDDIRAIKRAYAKAVKLARPDEHPEQFQAVNAAYKQAQKIARTRAKAPPPVSDAKPLDFTATEAVEPIADKTGAEETTLTSRSVNVELEQLKAQLQPQVEPESSVEVEIIQAPDLSEPEPPKAESQTFEIEVIAAPELADESAYEAERQQRQQEEAQQQALKEQELASMLAQVEELLGNPDGLNKVEHWRFIERSQCLLDDDFNWELAQELFECILAHNHQHTENPNNQLLDIRVFSYLDRFFDWRSNEEQLVEEYGEESCRPYFNALHQHTSNKDPLAAVKGGGNRPPNKADKNAKLENYVLAGRIGRVLANIIDWILFVFAAVLVNKLLPAQLFLEGDDVIYTILVPFLLFLIMESSALQATPGKLLMGYKVLRKDKTSVPWWLNTWRIICYTISMIGIKITFWINLFIGERILHDRFSGTIVVDMRKSQAQYEKSYNIEL